MIRTLRFAMLAGAAVLGCSESAPPSAPPRLNGEWKEVGNTDNVVSFGSGGEFRQVSYGTSYTGVWKSLKADQVEVRYSGDSARLGTVILQLSFHKDVLITRNPSGRVQEWKRP